MSERRQVPRYLADLKARVFQPPGGTALDVTAVNLSIKGCCLEAAGSLKVKQDCELTIEWEARVFRAVAVVAWKSSEGEAGLRFLDVDQANHDLLRKICANLCLQPLRSIPPEGERK